MKIEVKEPSNFLEADWTRRKKLMAKRKAKNKLAKQARKKQRNRK